jgi:hypothetical protein
MSEGPSCIERAFELAQSGKGGSLKSIHDQLKAEGIFEAGHLRGGSIRSQLVRLIATAKLRGLA